MDSLVGEISAGAVSGVVKFQVDEKELEPLPFLALTRQ
jgi:hypothetical protein